MIKIKNDLFESDFIVNIKTIDLTIEDFNKVDDFLELIKKISFVDEIKLCTMAKLNKSSSVFINNKNFNIDTLQEIINFFTSNKLSFLINQNKIKNLVGFKLGVEHKIKKITF